MIPKLPTHLLVRPGAPARLVALAVFLVALVGMSAEAAAQDGTVAPKTEKVLIALDSKEIVPALITLRSDGTADVDNTASKRVFRVKNLSKATIYVEARTVTGDDTHERIERPITAESAVDILPTDGTSLVVDIFGYFELSSVNSFSNETKAEIRNTCANLPVPIPVARFEVPLVNASAYVNESVYLSSPIISRTHEVQGEEPIVWTVTGIPRDAGAIFVSSKETPLKSNFFGSGIGGLVAAGAGLLKAKPWASAGECTNLWARVTSSEEFEAAAREHATELRTEFVMLDEIDYDTRAEVTLCHELGCGSRDKIKAAVVLETNEFWLRPAALLTGSFNYYADERASVEKYEWAQTSAGLGPQHLYRLEAEEISGDELMLALSLGATAGWERECDCLNRFFLGLTPVSLTGVKLRALTQVGGTVGARVWGPLYLSYTLMGRQVDVLDGGQRVGDAALVGATGGKPPAVLTRSLWMPVHGFGVGVDLAPLGEEVYKAASGIFGGGEKK